ncbi:hypothetical protein AGLY_016781, partial [Aphis glycines]
YSGVLLQFFFMVELIMTPIYIYYIVKLILVCLFLDPAMKSIYNADMCNVPICFSRTNFFLENNLSSLDTHSERSDECIDFTMMCVFFLFFFFVSVYSITSRNNAPISNYGGGFRCKSEYPWCIVEVKIFKKIVKNKKKNDGKQEFLRKTSFRPNRIFFMVVIQKLITEMSIKNFWMTKNVDKIFLALSKYLKILYKVPHMLFL